MGTKALDEREIQLLALKFVDELGIASGSIKESVTKDVTNALLVNLHPNKYPRKILVQKVNAVVPGITSAVDEYHP